MTDVLLVAAGGMFGGSARLMWATLANGPSSISVTLAENLIGTFLLAVVLTLLVDGGGITHRVRLAVGTGVLGSFTTTSTMAGEAAMLIEAGNLAIAAGYLAVSAFGGLACAWLVLRLGRFAQTLQRRGVDGRGRSSS